MTGFELGALGFWWLWKRYDRKWLFVASVTSAAMMGYLWGAIAWSILIWGDHHSKNGWRLFM